ncbi:hypothetical protein QQX98_000025 [Neonectria punicea]|uniref:Peptidase metallopeptidase domain-containing protein n=1 Tax=Neonectria punicea TaxID=979145 RepID=A0ABR1HVP8_9HYPO
MRVAFILGAISLLASSAEAGSRLWEVNQARASNIAADLKKRAVSIRPGNDHDDNGAVRRWPDKTLSFAFENSKANNKLKGIFHEAQEIWGVLRENGFSYNEVSMSKCKSYRDECLVITYNDKGILSSTVGIPPVNKAKDKSYVGPVMRLSDKEENVGNLNANVNAAHELGHAWGLYHEHQVDKWWKTSDLGEIGWLYLYTGDVFHTANYHCKNLKDYDTARDKLAKSLGKNSRDDLDEQDVAKLCRRYSEASKFGFSAMEWVPLQRETMDVDAEFDKDSLMLYPSGAGGIVDGDGADPRRPILTYAEDERIPIRHGPSTQDIGKLLALYGTEYRGTSKLLNDKDSSWKRELKKVRSKLSIKGGDTAQGLC